MRPSPEQQASYGEGVPLRRRVASIALALLAEALLVLMLLKLAPLTEGTPKGQGRLKTFDLSAEREQESGAKAAHQAQHATTARVPPRTLPKPPVPTVPPPPVPPQPSVEILHLTEQEYAASDIDKLPSHKGEGSGTGNGQSGAGADSASAGTGPHGEPLYRAEWYREPTHAEMATYLPHTLTGEAWGDVACRTIERFHVEDCVELDQSPPGSGMSRAVREMAWQFLVRPPRVGGKSLVGAWVRIRITVTPER